MVRDALYEGGLEIDKSFLYDSPTDVEKNVKWLLELKKKGIPHISMRTITKQLDEAGLTLKE